MVAETKVEAGRTTTDEGNEVIGGAGVGVEVARGLGVVQVVAVAGGIVTSDTNGVVTGS